MKSKIWTITLALLSRLTASDSASVGTAGGTFVHRNHPGEHPMDPESDFEDVYRMREQVARQQLLKHLHSPAAHDISATEVEYADEENEPRHRYHGNRLNSRPHLSTDEKQPEMTSNYQPPPVRSQKQGPKHVPTHYNHQQHHRYLNLGQKTLLPEAGEGESKTGGGELEENEPERPGEFIQTAPYVRPRSSIDAFQPISAAIAMQNSLNALEELQPPPPQPPNDVPGPAEVKGHEADRIEEVRPTIAETEDDHHEKAVHTGHHGDGEVVFRPPELAEGSRSEVQAALSQPKEVNAKESSSLTEVYFLAVVAGCSVAGFIGLVLAGVFYYRLRKKVKATSDVDYPAYGVTGPHPKEKESAVPGDRKLAQSAQMYHYQHQKQQMIASERLNSDVNNRGSDVDSEDENDEGDYTVFECPGLATNGDMEVRNPLFSENTPSEAPGTQTKK